LPVLREQFKFRNSMSIVSDFVRTYTQEAEPRIAFAWNGKHAAELIDANAQFRREVCKYFEDDAKACSLPLIAALFKAETLLAKEAWGVNRVVSRLAQEMLERGGADYLDHYLAGARCGMDAFMETGNIALSRSRCQELLEKCQANIASADGTGNQWKMLAERFSYLLSK